MTHKALVAALLLTCPATAAQAGMGGTLEFGLGGAVVPAYFGSDDYELGPTGTLSLQYLSIGRLGFGSPDGEEPAGFGLGGLVRFVGAREAADHPELAGLSDIDAALEVGFGVKYAAPSYRAFADIRYGATGHDAFVGEIGADAVARPVEGITLTAGPRLFFGSDRYASTYFGVTPAEAGASGLPAYAPDGGLLSAGVEIGMSYDLGDGWGIRGTLGLSRLVGGAADSPITELGSRSQGEASLILTRRISFRF
jgi:outer membrane protein